VYAVSENVRDHLIGEGFAPSTVGVIYNGIDLGPEPGADARSAVRGALGVDDATLVVGTIARLDPVKDLGALISAAEIISRDRRICLLIIGDGPERTALEALAARQPGSPDVRFVGHQDRAREWLPGCDVYANSSITEGVSLTILEAMAAGLPIVATRVGGTPEVVDGTCGYLVPARQPAALADAIVTLAHDPAKRAAFGTAARRRARNEFTLDRMVGEYRNVYDTLGRR
jgi:glycosyltransferase involved in cell wall biosynthesis